MAGRALLLQAAVERAKLAAASPYGGKHACRAAVRINLCHVLAVGHRLLLQPVQQGCVPQLLVSCTASPSADRLWLLKAQPHLLRPCVTPAAAGPLPYEGQGAFGVVAAARRHGNTL